MKTRSYISLAAIALFTIALTGCRSTHNITENSAKLSRKQRSELLAPLAQYPVDVETVSAKTTLTLTYEGFTTPTLKGRLRMHRDEMVQMSITAFGLMEIACVEFTPKGAYIIDKVNKRYALFDYSSGLMNYAGISFSAVQALFWNRIFIPGEKEAWKKAENFDIAKAGNQCLVEPRQQRTLKCKFYTDEECKHLEQTDLTLQQYEATWRYGQLETIGTFTYPTQHDVSVSGSSRAIGASINLTNISTLNTEWNSTDLSRYKEVDLDQVMSILNMLR